MKVLYFSRDYTPHDHRFLRALADTPHQVYFLRLENAGRAVEDRPLPPEIEQIAWQGGHGPARLSDGPRLVAGLRQVLGRLKPDLVHAGPIQRSAFLAALAGARPLVSMSWGYDLMYELQRGPLWQWAARFTLQRSAAFIGDCEAIRQQAEALGMPAERITIFPWGVDLNHFSPEAVSSPVPGSTPPFTILSTRGWEPIYGIETVAKSFILAARQRPNLRLVMLGGGSLAGKLRQMFSSAGVADQVYLPGQAAYADLPRYYRRADVYLSASHSDGSSISLLEAFACGLPAIVSDIPGNREWVTPGQTGWIAPLDNAAAFAEAIIQAADDRLALARLGLQARQVAEQRADWPANFQKLLTAYESVAVVHPPQRGGAATLRPYSPSVSSVAPLSPRVVAIVQARMSSTRLPGKVLRLAGGQSLLSHVLDRLHAATTLTQIVVATTTQPDDDPIAALCAERGQPCFRGSLHDVLDRFYQAALAYQADVVVRITADCPLVDPELVDLVVRTLLGQADPPGRSTRMDSPTGPPSPFAYDFVANRLPPPWSRTYPIGLDVEAVTFQALARAWREAREKHQREHVLPYLYEDIGLDFAGPARFRVRQVDHSPDYGALRWTVDTPADFELVQAIFDHFAGQPMPGWQTVREFLASRPDLTSINAGVIHKSLLDA